MFRSMSSRPVCRPNHPPRTAAQKTEGWMDGWVLGTAAPQPPELVPPFIALSLPLRPGSWGGCQQGGLPSHSRLPVGHREAARASACGRCCVLTTRRLLGRPREAGGTNASRSRPGPAGLGSPAPSGGITNCLSHGRPSETGTSDFGRRRWVAVSFPGHREDVALSPTRGTCNCPQSLPPRRQQCRGTKCHW